MNSNTISLTRLKNQQITPSSSRSPKKLVHHLGAMQAQDYNWVKWAIGLRLPNSTIETVEDAIASGKIIRTHLLRPTWHFVSADDLRWMLQLTAPRVMIAIRSRHKQLGLSDDIITRSRKVIEKALAEADYLTRKEIAAVLKNVGYENKNNLHSHLLMRAELDGVICSGPTKGKHHTYALFEKRVPPSKPMNKDECLKRLAEIYFTSHGPATLDDFVWWSGLTKTMARHAIEMMNLGFEQFKTNSKTYWHKLAASETGKHVYLLPAYDEFLVGYTDRSAVLADRHHKKVISKNGIFKPVIVVNGKVTGIWKRKTRKTKVRVEAVFFRQPNDQTKQQTKEAAEGFARFLGKELEFEETQQCCS